MMICLLLLFVSLCCTVDAVRMSAIHFSDMIDAFIQIHIIPTILTTASEFSQLQALNLVEPPECPFANHIYSCNSVGQMTRLNITPPTLSSNESLFLDLESSLFSSGIQITIRNFVGTIRSRSTAGFTNVTIVDSTLTNVPAPSCLARATCKFIFSFGSAFTSLFLRNVTLLSGGDGRPSNSVPDSEAVGPSNCSFENVQLPCPVPSWLAHCFNFTNSASVPCVTPTQNASSAFQLVPTRHNGCREFRRVSCLITCTPPPAIGFSCVSGLGNDPNRGYFPETPGFATIELVAGFVGVAHAFFATLRERSAVVKIEVWDWQALNWNVTDFGLQERSASTHRLMASFRLPPVITNRIRVTLEQWFPSSDIVVQMEWDRLLYGEPPGFSINLPPRQCALAESYSTRSMLDETIADSYCIGHLCQFACQFANNFTFDRSVVPRFVVIEGGSLWNGAPLEAMPSDDTRVYRYNASSQPISALNLTLSGLKRVRLIGDPVNGEPLPLPKLPSKRGMPGIFVKRRMRSLPSGFAQNNSTADQSQCQAALPDGTFSTAVVANVTFVFTNAGDLLSCAMNGGNWINETDAARLTRITVNSGASVAVRRLVSVDDRLLMVVSAHTVLHDGSMQRQLVNRVVVSSGIDVLDVASDSWFNNLLQHDIGGNITDIGVAAHQNGSFAVVAQESGAAMVFEWRPYPYKLIECGDNKDCRSCLSSEANDEMCRWCGSRCVSLQAACVGNERSTISLSMCEPLTTTTTATTNTTNTTTKATSMTATTETGGGSGTSMDSTVASLSIGISATNSSTDLFIPLYAVVGAVGGLAVIGAIGALVWKIRRRSHSAAESPSAEQRNKENQDDIAMQRYSAFGADDQVADGHEPASRAGESGNYDDSSVLR
jgi:hypothetical protein